jgi:ketosteroid isomerase-like protein
VSEKSTTPDLEDAIRRGLDAVTRHDFDTALSLWMPDGVWELSPGFHLLEMGPLVGHEAIRQLYEDVTGAFEDFEFAAEEVHDLGSGVTFSVLVQRGRPHGSGVFVERRYGGVAIWRGGLHRHRRGPRSRRKARRATGVGDVEGVHDARPGGACAVQL